MWLLHSSLSNLQRMKIVKVLGFFFSVIYKFPELEKFREKEAIQLYKNLALIISNHLLKHSWRNWRGCSIVKSICCSCKGPRFTSQYNIVVHNHLSSSRESCAAFTAGIHVINRHTCVSHTIHLHFIFFHIFTCFSSTFLISCFFYLIIYHFHADPN